MYVEIDRDKVKAAQVSLSDVNLALQSLIGSYYVNDFSFQGRNWQVNLQADPASRLRSEDVGRLEVVNASGHRIQLNTLIDIRPMTGPAAVYHYNLYPSADLVSSPAPGASSGQCIQAMERLAQEHLPPTLGFQWTDLAYQQIEAGKDALSVLIFPLAVLFVFLVLAAQYESWSLPFVILLIVPMVVLSALTGVWAFGLDINIFVQIGFVVLIGLAAKNAILVVEFAKQQEEESGLSKEDAVVQACKTRLRPILMTAFAFILGCVPLMISKGAGAEMRVPLGTAVVFGMTGVTVIGLFFTPVFYTLIHRRKTKPARGLTRVAMRITDVAERSDKR
jgi:multidrug efflux pump